MMRVRGPEGEGFGPTPLGAFPVRQSLKEPRPTLGADTLGWTDERIRAHLDGIAQEFVDVLNSRLATMERALEDSWTDVHESNFTQAATSLKLQPQAESYVKINTIIGYVGAPTPANMGLIELGNYDAIPIPTGQIFSLGGGWRLSNTDIRIISSVTGTNLSPGARASGAAGYLYLALFGKEIPRERQRL